MSLSQFLELAINKFTKLKKEAPLTKGRQDYEIKSAYSQLFNNIFTTDLQQKINSQSMQQDMSNYQNMNNLCFRDSSFSNATQYNELTENNKYGLKYADNMNEFSKTYIKKICEVILNDKYDVINETEINIIIYYWMLKIIPVYYEISTGIYNILDQNKRYELSTKINQYINLININTINKNSLQVNINHPTNFNSWLYLGFIKDCITPQQKDVNFIKLIETISNVYIDMEKINIYKKNNELPKPEPKPEVKAEPKQEVKQEVKPTPKQEVKPEVKTDIITITSEYNSKKPNYKKDDLIKLALNINIVGATRLTIALLEEAIIEKQEGKTNEEKANKLKIDGNLITEKGYQTAIIEFLTNTMKGLDDNKNIPKTIKSLVWDKYVGKEKGVGSCYVCKKEVDSKHFELGHIQAKAKGGTDEVDNLRPVCSLCNKSIGTKNMDEFKKEYKL